MKIPEKSPRLAEVLSGKHGIEMISKFHLIPVELSKKWLEDYKYWTKFKYERFPEGITPETAWIKREFDIASQKTPTPVYDRQGTPFYFWLSSKAQRIIYSIDRSMSSDKPLTDLREDAEKNKYLTATLIEEAANSSIIEGAVTTRRQAKEFIASKKEPSNKSEWMILNNFEAIKYIKTVKDQPLSLEMIQELHRIMTKNTLNHEADMGRFRISPDDDDIVITDDSQYVMYTPPPGSEVLARLQKVMDFVNTPDSDKEMFINPIVKAIILHFAISYIHPFVDGNGRTARALFYWYMLRNDYWLFEYISISRLMLRRHSDYNKAFLYSEQSENDMTYFVNFHLEVIEIALKEFHDYLHKQKVDLSIAEPFFKKWPELNGRQKDILINAMKSPGKKYVIERHRVLHDITYATARADFLGLEKLGLLLRSQEGKAFVFTPMDNLQKALLNRLNN
ncbi:Fic family protein [Parelusimicrobium proximum]|uniref:Fic family protein n=1 Tax=Parelusimicrobium proximum TaxID=3228953 RepID=UPI003D17080B